MNKIDDVRYDVRKAGNAAKIGLLALSGALGLVAISNIVRSANASQNNGG